MAPFCVNGAIKGDVSANANVNVSAGTVQVGTGSGQTGTASSPSPSSSNQPPGATIYAVTLSHTRFKADREEQAWFHYEFLPKWPEGVAISAPACSSRTIWAWRRT